VAATDNVMEDREQRPRSAVIEAVLLAGLGTIALGGAYGPALT
jgi:hypothetical protein